MARTHIVIYNHAPRVTASVSVVHWSRAVNTATSIIVYCSEPTRLEPFFSENRNRERKNKNRYRQAPFTATYGKYIILNALFHVLFFFFFFLQPLTRSRFLIVLIIGSSVWYFMHVLTSHYRLGKPVVLSVLVP